MELILEHSESALLCQKHVQSQCREAFQSLVLLGNFGDACHQRLAASDKHWDTHGWLSSLTWGVQTLLGWRLISKLHLYYNKYALLEVSIYWEKLILPLRPMTSPLYWYINNNSNSCKFLLVILQHNFKYYWNHLVSFLI